MEGRGLEVGDAGREWARSDSAEQGVGVSRGASGGRQHVLPVEVLPRARGVVHECFGVAAWTDDARKPDARPSKDVQTPLAERSRGRSHGTGEPGLRESAWVPPLCFLVHLARASLADAESGSGGVVGKVVWVGRRCWPWAGVMCAGSADLRRVMRASVCVDAKDLWTRVWVMELALRSPGVSVVMGDGSGLTMALSRRLQLAASSRGTGERAVEGAGESPLCVLARPVWEMKELSAAATRWVVRRAPRDDQGKLEGLVGARADGWGMKPRWEVELVRHKGLWQGCALVDQDVPAGAVLEWDHEAGACVVSAHVVRGPDSSAGAGEGTRTAGRATAGRRDVGTSEGRVRRTG